MKLEGNFNRRDLIKNSKTLLTDFLGQLTASYIETKKVFDELAEENRSDQSEMENILDPKRSLLRPPGAVKEDLFKKLCDACDECIKGCPEDVLFRAPKSRDELGRPTFNPAVKGCFLCIDLHCIKVCTKGALIPPESVSKINIGKARIDPSLCIAQNNAECSECVNHCPLPEPAIRLLGKVPLIDSFRCVGCGRCETICYNEVGKKAITTLARLF